MNLDFLIFLAPLVFAVVVIVLLEGSNLVGRQDVVKPPSITHPWKAKHPNGTITHIEYWRTNANGITMWKFKGFEREVASEFEYDVYQEKGAEAGSPSRFFYFRKNPDGTTLIWGNIIWKKYFQQMKERKIVEESRESEVLAEREIVDASNRSIERELEDNMAKDYVLHNIVNEKIYSEKKKKKKKEEASDGTGNKPASDSS